MSFTNGLQWKKTANPATRKLICLVNKIIYSFVYAFSPLKPEPVLPFICYYSLQARMSPHSMPLNIPRGTQRDGSSFVLTAKHSLCLERCIYVLKNINKDQKTQLPQVA